MEDRQNFRSLVEALHEFQRRCPVVQFDKVVPTKSGGVQYRFASFEQVTKTIRPLLKDCGLFFTFSERLNGEQLTIVCTVYHTSGAKTESEFTTPIGEGPPNSSKTQKTGAADKYAKRRALMNALGIATGEDDDEIDARQKPDAVTKDDIINLRTAWGAAFFPGQDPKPLKYEFEEFVSQYAGLRVEHVYKPESWTAADLAACRAAIPTT